MVAVMFAERLTSMVPPPQSSQICDETARSSSLDVGADVQGNGVSTSTTVNRHGTCGKGSTLLEKISESSPEPPLVVNPET